VSEIRKALRFPENMMRTVRRTLEDIVEKGEAWESHPPSAPKKRKLSVAECEVVGDMLRKGLGLAQATFNLNDLRDEMGLSPVVKETVRSSVFALLGARRSKTRKKKTGKTDPERAWAKARLAQALQYRQQLGRGMRTSRGGNSGLELEAIGWWDEKHAKCVLGHSNKHQWDFPIDPSTGRYCAVEDGGQYQGMHEVTQPKFDQEARFAFGVMMKRVDGGRRLSGVKMEPYEYTGKKMLGVAEWEKAVYKELERVEDLKGGVWARVPSGIDPATGEFIDGGRYYRLYGDEWMARVEDKLATVCVTRLIDHIIVEMDKAFADTPYKDTYVIAHDALSQFTEKGARAYLRSKGFDEDRLLGPRDGTNAGTRYEDKQVGDTPELMPLDSNLFSDLSYGCKQHRAMTWRLSNDDPRKFKYGTPKEVSDTMRRTWTVCPTPERIVQDIQRFPAALDAIIAANGAYVDELDNRKGRRARKTRKFIAHSDCDDVCADDARRYREMLADVRESAQPVRSSPRRPGPVAEAAM